MSRNVDYLVMRKPEASKNSSSVLLQRTNLLSA
jgi:hypothetical protein